MQNFLKFQEYEIRHRVMMIIHMDWVLFYGFHHMAFNHELGHENLIRG